MKRTADILFSSLQVFDPEDHASLHSDKSKEGLSIYGASELVIWVSVVQPDVGILNNTRTTLGRNLLREWLLRPSLSLSVIVARHAAVACFVNPDNMTTADEIQGHLSGIKNTPRILKMLKSGKAKIGDWQGAVEVRTKTAAALCTEIVPVTQFAFHAAMIRDSVTELIHANQVDLLKKVSTGLFPRCSKKRRCQADHCIGPESASRCWDNYQRDGMQPWGSCGTFNNVH